MRKIISFLLSVAMMLLLSVSIFAETITSMSVDFHSVLDTEIPKDFAQIDISGNSSITTSQIRYRLTGVETIKAFEEVAFDTSDELLAFCLGKTLSIDHTNYNSQEYLFVFSCVLPDDTSVDNDIVITTPSGDEGTYLFTGVNGNNDNEAYFYIKFTPQSDNSEEFKELTTSQPIDVTVTYDDSVTETPVYSVVITWGSMDFTYHPAFKGTWDPTTHTYIGEKTESWTCEENANAITVTNHSNAAITASFTFTPNAAYKEIEGTFYDGNQHIVNSQNIASADGGSGSAAPSFTAFLKLSGTLANNKANQERCGYVTVTISE